MPDHLAPSMTKLTAMLLLVALFSVPGSATAQELISRVSLEEAIALARRQNPTLRAKAFEYQATKAGEITAGLRPNPTASFTSEKFGAHEALEHTSTIEQTIELGGKRRRRLESARAATRVTGYELEDVQRQILFQVKKSFTDVLVAQAVLVLAEENLKTLDEIQRIQRVRAEKGEVSELELLRIEVERFSFERDAADARQAVRAGKIALRAVVGPDGIADEFEIIGDLTFREFVYRRPDLQALAVANRPDLRAAAAARDKARADFNLARANASWDIAPQIQYQRIGDANTFGFGISAPLRIFDRNQGEIARTRAEIERADALQQAVTLDVLSEVDRLLSELLTEQAKLMVLGDTYLPKARRARDTVAQAYRRGGLTLLDLLDAQRTYRETAQEHMRTFGNYLGAIYELESAVGGTLEK